MNSSDRKGRGTARMKPARSAVRWAMVVIGGKLNRAEMVILINQQSRGGHTYQSTEQSIE